MQPPDLKTPEWAFWLETANAACLEIAATLSFDAVVLDMEHGVIDQGAADELIARARLLHLKTYVRVAAPQRVPIQYALDSGADGVILPQIIDLAHAREACAYAKYPPRAPVAWGTTGRCLPVLRPISSERRTGASPVSR